MDQLSGRTRLFPIIGDPIVYVESPASLTRTLAARGHDGMCVPMHVAAAHLGEVMSGLAAVGNVDGVLVTMPHKAAASAYCATRSDRVEQLGVVSVIRRNDDGSWHGDMLDGVAFVKAQRVHGALVEGSRALLLGAGGAGSAIALALVRDGVGELVIHDADAARAETLVRALADLGAGRVRTGAADPTGMDLVLNATPVGMNEGDPFPVAPDLLTSSMFVGDVIAGHGVTPLIAAARGVGCATATGGDMVEAVQDLMADFLLHR